MGYKARWGPMGFVISPSKIVPFDKLTTTIAVKSDSGNDTSGTSATNNRGRELQSIQFTTQYLSAVGVDPRERFEEWSALVGSSHPLYVGEKRFGPAKMTLMSVAVSDSLLSAEGVFLSMTLNITLEEDATTTTKKSSKTASKKTTTAKSSSAKKAAETYAKTVEKKKAMQATAPKDERRAKIAMDRRMTV